MATNTPNPSSPPTLRSSRKNWIVLALALALGTAACSEDTDSTSANTAGIPSVGPNTGPAVSVNTDNGTAAAGRIAIAEKNATGPSSRTMDAPTRFPM